MAPKKNLSVLLYGDFTWDRLAASYKRAFEQQGHQVIPVDTQQINQYLSPWLSNRIGYRLTLRSLQLRRWGSKRWNEQLNQLAQDVGPELLFILNGEFLMPETLQGLHERGISVFIFHADNPFPPHNNNRPETLPCALVSDCYFIWSHLLVERLKGIGVKRVEYLPFAWDSKVFPYEPPSDHAEYDHDVVFVGGWDKKREAWLTAVAQHFNLKIWGPDYWGTRTRLGSPLRNCWQGHAIRGHEASQILRRSRIALNILRSQNMPDGVIMRTFELPGCGGFSLATRTQGAVEIFPEEQAGTYFASIEECLTQIDSYLKLQDNIRQQMAHEAHTIVCNGHQYTDRAQKIITTFKVL